MADLVEDAPAPCPVCKGFGFLETPDGRRVVPCACKAGEHSSARMRGARIPDRYRGCSLANFNTLHASQAAAKALARRFIESWPVVGAGLLIVGPVGRGKTHLATAILAEIVDARQARGIFCDTTELLDRIQATFSKSEETADDVLTPFKEAEIMVLDELGARRPTEWGRDTLYALLNARYNQRRITLVTTNFMDEGDRAGAETLESRIGVPLRSRLAEMCQYVPLDGPDFRREVKQGRAFA